jgi:alpha-D-xyloside xylohydrolase
MYSHCAIHDLLLCFGFREVQTGMDSVFKIEGDRLVWEYDGETLWVEPWGADSFRVRATRMATMQNEEWALLPPEPRRADISLAGGNARIKNGRIRAEIEPAGRVFFYNQKNELLLKEYVRRWDSPTSPCALRIEGREFTPCLGGDYGLTVRFESDPEEKIFGMGQYQQPFLNVKNCVLELAHRNSQASVPFALSNKGFGFLWNNPSIGRVAFGKNMTEWTARSVKQMDYWITAGDRPAEIEEAYARATGTVPLMPDFGTGFWQCKLRYRTQDELIGIAREYRRRGLPISVIVVDFFHWTKQGDWKFDETYWPDPERMTKELREMGIELMVSFWPTVDKTSEQYAEMLQKGYLTRTERGVRSTMQFCGDTLFYDATNPDARDYVWKIVKRNYYDKGIRVFWLDEAEPEFSAYDFDNYRYSAGTCLQVGNVYPVHYARTFFDGMSAAGQKNVLNLIRCAWAGSQRYGALVWSGDVHSSFESFRNQLRAGLNMGLAGIPWWTSDIGGFFGADINDPAYRECIVRWFQFGAFCPVFRLHGDRAPHAEPTGTSGGGLFGSGASNEVWSYGEEAFAIMKKYLLIREYLRPYISQCMREAHEKGTPVIRPLFYDFPEDKEAWNIDDQYMFGNDILVAPIMHDGERSRKTHLPAGSRWIDVATGKLRSGGVTIESDAPLDTIPLYLREGTKLAPDKLK